MRRLMLLRHAKTETEAASGRDQDRQLDERGRRDAAEIAGFIGEHLPLPDAAMVSSAARAHQTWDIVRETLKNSGRAPVGELKPELYAAEAATLLQAVRSAAFGGAQTLLVIGHNPGLHELALALCGSGDDAARQALSSNLPTAGLAVFEFATEDWEDVAFRRGRLLRFVTPKLLRPTPDTTPSSQP
jgi:phosphohistidine phosphatase